MRTQSRNISNSALEYKNLPGHFHQKARTFFIAFVLLFGEDLAAFTQNFIPGNIVVYKVGDGADLTDTAVCTGAASFFSVIAAPGVDATFSCQGQLSIDTGGSWNEITNIGVYTNAATATHNILSRTGLNSYQYRCVIIYQENFIVISDPAGLTVEAVPAKPTANNTGPYCVGGTISYAWTAPGECTSAFQNSTIASATLAMAGTYRVTVIISGNKSLPGTTTVVVNV